MKSCRYCKTHDSPCVSAMYVTTLTCRKMLLPALPLVYLLRVSHQSAALVAPVSTVAVLSPYPKTMQRTDIMGSALDPLLPLNRWIQYTQAELQTLRSDCRHHFEQVTSTERIQQQQLDSLQTQIRDLAQQQSQLSAEMTEIANAVTELCGKKKRAAKYTKRSCTGRAAAFFQPTTVFFARHSTCGDPARPSVVPACLDRLTAYKIAPLIKLALASSCMYLCHFVFLYPLEFGCPSPSSIRSAH